MNPARNNHKRIFIWIFLAFCIICAGLCACTGIFFNVHADVKNSEKTEAELYLPSSYEQYLALENPVDIAFSETYIAIADGKTLYLYDLITKSFSRTIIPEGNSTITKIGFAGNRLFASVRAASNFFYEYDFSKQSLTKLTINCSTFLINNNVLYTANVGGQSTTIASYSVSDMNPESSPMANDLGTVNEHSTPSMTILGDELYCTFSDHVYCIAPSSETFNTAKSFYLSTSPSNATNVQSTCVHENNFYYTAEGGLYRSDMISDTTRTSLLLIEGAGFGALSSYNGNLYAVKGSSIVEIGIEDNQATLTGYEISTSSDSVNRLSKATDTARAGDLLVTADAGNQRISVSKLARTENGLITQSTYVIPCRTENGEPYTPTRVATDGELIAVAAEDCQIYLYQNGKTAYHYRHSTEGNPVMGLACVYGKVYFITEHTFGMAEEGQGLIQRNNGKTNYALASDVYGNLFVVYGDGTAAKFSESGFLDTAAQGEPLDFRLPEHFSSLRADFEGNLYCLNGNNLVKNGTETLVSISGSDYVYTMSESSPLVFALSYEDDEVFFLFGDYIVKTDAGALDIPTLSKISAEGVAEAMFAPHGKDGLLIDVPAGTIGVRTDLGKFRSDDPAYFPYLSYYRTAESKRGILLATKDRYALVILYEVGETDRVFEADLFLLDKTDIVPTEEYSRESAETMYLTNDVSAYFFPCLHQALADTRLARGTRVAVCGYVSAPERDYALVEFETAEGARARGTGFVPAAYLTAVDPIPGEETVFEPAYLKASAEGTEFVADDGSAITVTERTRAEFTDNGDGTYTARITVDGKAYYAKVAPNRIDRGESDAVRIALIIILTALAVGIVGGYVYLLPRKVGPGKYEDDT